MLMILGNIDRVQRLLKIIDVNSKNDISYTDLEQAFESRKYLIKYFEIIFMK